MIVLTGFMGAGKSTVGSMLAEKLGLPFVDIDIHIEQRRGRPVRTIFQEEGEQAFRQLEHEAILEIMCGSDAVVAVGGGAVEHPETRRTLRDHATVVYLVVSYDEAIQRIGHDVDRPMLHVDDVRGLYKRRLRVYEQSATLAIATDGRDPETVVLDLLSRIHDATGGERT